MPLSEEELRLLEQMERALVAEDPKLASTLRGNKMRRAARRHMVLGVLVFLGGIALLMAGAVLPSIPLGVIGFVVMLASAYWTLTTWRSQNAAPLPGDPAPGGDPTLRVVQGGRSRRARPGRPAGRPQRQGTLMQRFEERWRRRREQGGL